MQDAKPNRDKAARSPAQRALADEKRDKFVRQQIEKERAESAVKTAKLKALRLAKESEEKALEDRTEQPATLSVAPRKRFVIR